MMIIIPQLRKTKILTFDIIVNKSYCRYASMNHTDCKNISFVKLWLNFSYCVPGKMLLKITDGTTIVFDYHVYGDMSCLWWKSVCQNQHATGIYFFRTCSVIFKSIFIFFSQASFFHTVFHTTSFYIVS